MLNQKRSTVEKFGIPLQLAKFLLTLFVVLALSPYLGGVDFGIITIPLLPAATAPVLKYAGPLLVLAIVAVLVPLWPTEGFGSGPVDEDSKYAVQSIADIVQAEAASHGVGLDGILIDDDFSILDLERMCVHTRYPNLPKDAVCKALHDARAKAFTEKYAQPREDEKLAPIANIQIDSIKPWHEYFVEVLHDIGIRDIRRVGNILDVGIGNGYSMEHVWGRLNKFHAVDISPAALALAKVKFPQMKSDVCEAEDLKGILSRGSVDLYVSLRTYQSRLFDRRTALHEAYRVLRNGGRLVLSVPIMFLRSDGTVLPGLIRRGSKEPTMAFAEELVKELARSLDSLNFKKVKIDRRSPFEIYVTAKR